MSIALRSLVKDGTITKDEAQFIDDRNARDQPDLETVFPELLKKIDGVTCKEDGSDDARTVVILGRSVQRDAGVQEWRGGGALEPVSEDDARALVYGRV